MRRAIRAFHQDPDGDWVAELDCGHPQHVRHRPPFQDRPWVLDEVGRSSRIGAELECRLCDHDEGGEPACQAALVCVACGGVDGHRAGCPQG